MTNDARYPKEWRVAFHEAGHAVANVLYGRAFGHVTVIASKETGALGGVDSNKPGHLGDYRWNRIGSSEEPIDWNRRKEADREMFCLLAGSAAEFLFCKQDTHEGSEHDLKNAELVAKINYPLEDRNSPVDYGAASWYRGWAYQHMIHTLAQWVIWGQVGAVARALKERKVLSYDEVRRLMEKTEREKGRAQ